MQICIITRIISACHRSKHTLSPTRLNQKTYLYAAIIFSPLQIAIPNSHISSIDYLPIIIMLPKHTNFSLDLAQSLPLQVSLPSVEQPSGPAYLNFDPQSETPLGSSLTGISTHLEMLWKKQFKCFLEKSGKKHGGKSTKQLKKDISLCLSLFKNHQPVEQALQLEAASPKNIFYTTLNTYFQSQKRSKKPSILILGPLQLNSLQKELLLSFVVLSLDGKILYNKYFKLNWKEIHEQHDYINKLYNINFKVVQEKQSILNFVPHKQSEIRAFVEESCDFDEATGPVCEMVLEEGPSGVIQVLEKATSNFEGLKKIREALLRFNFIKSQLYKTFKKKQSFRTLHPRLFPLAYNLILPVVNTLQQSLLSQVDPYISPLRSCFRSFISRDDEHLKNLQKSNHYPQELENAQFCKICLKARTYICCQLCSMINKKTMALCHECFGLFHNRTQSSQKSIIQIPIYLKWELFNSAISYVISNPQPTPENPFLIDLQTPAME